MAEGFFSTLKNNYLDFVENLREKGVPVPHLLVPLLIVLIIAGAALYFSPELTVEKRSFSLTVKDSLARPVTGATVELISNGKSIANKTSDPSGKISFTDVPITAEVKVNAEGYTTKTRLVSDLQPQSTISLQSSGPATRDVTVKVLASDGNPLEGAFVQLTFANGDLAPAASTDAGGNAVITIQETQLQIGGGTITISHPSFQSTQQAVSQEQLASGLPIIITVSSQEPVITSGKLTVTVSSNTGAVQGASVTLVNIVTDSEVASKTTFSDGIAVFDVSFGTAFTVRATHPQFNDASVEFTPTVDSNELSVALTQRTSPASEVKLTITSEGLSPLEASVNLFDAGSNTLLESGGTDSLGEFTASVSPTANLYATVFSENYLPAFVPDLKGGSTKLVKLEQVIPGNSVPLTVIVSQDGFPASNAEVSLYRSGGFFLGIPPFHVGPQGMANVTIPQSFNGQQYKIFAKASKEAYFGQSDAVDVSSTPISLSIDLLALPANVTITLKDISTGQGISTGLVEAIVEGLAVSNCVVSNGKCVLTVAPNKLFSIRVSSQGYLAYSTSLRTYSSGEKAELAISLFPLSLAQGATVNFIGLFDSNNVKVAEVANAETYKAKFAVNLPQNIEKAGFYLQVGDEQTVETSVGSIVSFDSNGAVFVQSDSELPSAEDCYAGKNTPNTDDKWVYFSFPKGFVGTKEFSVNVKVSKTAGADSSLKLIYKAFGFKDNLPLLAPSDAELLDSLRQKTDQGLQLAPQDTCEMKVFSKEIPVSQQTLTCTEEDLCWKATLFDASGNKGTPSTFQPEIAKQFTLELEIIPPTSIDSLAVSTDYFSLQGATAANKQFNIPFTALAGKKAKATLVMLPLKVTQSALLEFLLKSGEKIYSIPLTLPITGTNKFTVTVAPDEIPAAKESKIIVIVRDKNNKPVEDAFVSLYECDGAPFSGNEPPQIAGDGSLDNGQNGRYKLEVITSGRGEIGVRVEGENFKTFESCAVTVIATEFLSIEPDAMEFTGSSLQSQAQQVTLSNSLNEPIKVSSSINCGGDPVPLKVFPLSTTIDPNSDGVVSVKLLENSTSNTQCIASFNAKAGSFTSTEELPISVNVNCDNCALSVSTGLASAPLPNSVTLFVVPPFLQDVVTIPLRLNADPTCRLDGFRINYAGTYMPGFAGYPQGYPSGYPPQGQGVLSGIPTTGMWWCAACQQPDASGKSQCNYCGQVNPSAYRCGACTPSQVTAPTSSQLPFHYSASCSQCFSAYSGYASTAFMSPLAYQGYPTPFNPAFPPGLQRQGFDPSVGAIYHEDFAYSGNYYQQQQQVQQPFGVYPSGLPSAPYNPRFQGYNYGSGFSRQAIRDALRVEECSKDAITIAADYSFLGQAFPGTGNLQVTLPDGSVKTIMLNVFGSPGGIGSGIPFGAPTWETACGVQTFTYDVNVGPDYKLTSAFSLTLTCPTTFNLAKVESVKTKENESIDNKCEASIAGNEFKLNCDFGKSENAKKALENSPLYVKAVLLSSQNPNALVEINLKATFQKQVVAPQAQQPPQQQLQQPPQPQQQIVELNVFKASDSSQRNLCGNSVEVGANLKVKYSFSQGDVASERKITVKKGSAVEKTLTPGQSGVEGYVVSSTGLYSFEAVTKYGAALASKTCQVNVVDKAPLIQEITPLGIVLSGALPVVGSFFEQHGSVSIATQLNLNKGALKAKTEKVKVGIEYKCTNGNKLLTKQDTLDVDKITDSTLFAKFNSLEFTRCAPVVDAVIPYTIKVTLTSENGQVLETAYYGEKGAPVSEESKASKIMILNLPEAPPKELSEIPLDQLDGCSRLDAPRLSEMYLKKENGNAVKTSEVIAPGQTFKVGTCSTDASLNGKTIEFFASTSTTSGSDVTTSLSSCQVNTLSTLNSNSFGCNANFATDLFLSQDAQTKKLIDMSKPVSFYSQVTGTSSQRFLCKYWPDKNGQCEKVEFKIDAKDSLAYDKSQFCKLLEPGNPNKLICDVATDIVIKLPIAMRVQFNEVAENDVDFNGFYGVDSDVKIDCDSGIGKEGDFNPNKDSGKWIGCFDGGKVSTTGDATPLFAVKFVRKLSSNEVPTGYWNTAAGGDYVRVEIHSQFGANNDWLKNFYHFNFDRYSTVTGQLVKQAVFVEKPRKKLADLLGKTTAEVDESFGTYSLGIDDVVKVIGKESNGKGNSGIIRFVGISKDGEFLFEVRRRDRPVIQECNDVLFGVPTLFGAAAGALVCFIPSATIAACPVVLGAAGAGAGAAYQEITDTYQDLLPVKQGEQELCRPPAAALASYEPVIIVRVIGSRTVNANGNALPEVCIVASPEDYEEQVEKVPLNVKDACGW